MKQLILCLGLVVALSGCTTASMSNSEILDLKKQVLDLQKVQGNQAAEIEELDTKLLLLKDQLDKHSGPSKMQPEAPKVQKTEVQKSEVPEVSLPTEVETTHVANQVVPADRTKGLSASPQKLYDDAVAASKKFQFAQIEKDVQILLKDFRESPLTNNALYLLAQTYFQNGQYSRASEQFERLYKMFPDGNKAVASLYYLGVCYEKLGHSDEAKEAYQNVITIYPGSREALEASKRLQNGVSGDE